MVMSRLPGLACALAATLVFLPACTMPARAPAHMRPPPPASVSSGAPPANICHVEAVRDLLGRRYADDMLEPARAAAEADLARVLHPGTIVTQEFREGRLNIRVDDHGRVEQVYCG